MNIKLIIPVIIALGIGLAAGYFLFAGANVADHTGYHGTNSGEAHQHDNMESPADASIWTCSMHPQIRQPEPGDCAICGMDLIPLAENTSNDPLVLQMTTEAVKLANIQTTIVGEADGNTSKVTRLSGKIQKDERRASALVSHVAGRIEKLFVTFTGEQVYKGQEIASIYSPELVSAQQELLEAIKLQSVNPDLLKAARDKLRFWKIEDAVIQQIESTGTIQETFKIYAGQSGTIQEKKVEIGDYVQRGEVLFDVINLNRLWVLFDAYEEDLGHIRKGDQIEFSTPALPNKTFKTKVTFIDPLIDPKTRVASIRAEVDNRQNQLKPEMLVYGTLEQSRKNAKTTTITVPSTAVLWTGTRSVVYVKVLDATIPSYQFREIEIGERLGDQYVVMSGLEAGEEVVTKGGFSIDAAAQLNNQASMMNRQVKIKKDDGLVVVPDFTTFVPTEFQRQLRKVIDSYLALKDALVQTDPISGGSSANNMLNALENIETSLLDGEALEYWQEQFVALKAHVQAISDSEAVEEQRKQFNYLSEAMINVVKAFGVSEQPIYVQHCPMANDDQGADWLSREEEIRNPYFGDVMLKCGVVKEALE